MRRIIFLIAIVVGAGGCAQDSAERLKAYNEDGLALYSQGHFNDARESFEAALALKKDDPALLYNIGQCYDHEGNAAQAEKYYHDCLTRDPDHVASHYALTKLMVKNQRMPDAVSHVQNWLTSSPKIAAAHAEDGWLWHEQGDLPKAQARLEQALLLDPHEWRALTELGLVYEGLQRPDRALVLYERSLAENPSQPDVKGRVTKLKAEGAGPPKPE
jgi:tetratricopeptide (TPR) repeat protein